MKINNQNKVAYIVPVYNVNKYLDECLNSLSQIKTPKQVIIVDDRGSEDPFPIISKYLSDTSFLYFKNEKNLGLGFARNEGMKRISNDVTHVYFVDSDDYVLPDKIDEVVCDLQPNFSFLISTYKSITKNSNRIVNVQDDTKCILPFAVWGSFWRADFCKQNKFASKTFEDVQWIIAFFNRINSDWSNFKTLPITTYVYRRRGSSISSTKMSLSNARDFCMQQNEILHSNIYKLSYGYIESAMFRFLDMKRKHKKLITIPNYNLTKLAKIWVYFAYYMQKLTFFRKISLKRNRKDFFE